MSYHHLLTLMAMVLALTLMLFGTGYTGGLGSDGESRSEAPLQDPAAPDAGPVVLLGTIDDYGLLVDPLGDTFRLADSGQGMEVKSLIGKVVKIEGTVMQVQGEREVAVNRFTILE
jgi:hypothetical protein